MSGKGRGCKFRVSVRFGLLFVSLFCVTIQLTDSPIIGSEYQKKRKCRHQGLHWIWMDENFIHVSSFGHCNYGEIYSGGYQSRQQTFVQGTPVNPW